VKSDGLGCPAYNYTNTLEFYGSSSNPSGAWHANFAEQDGRQTSFRTNPAYIWYGPGIRSNYEIIIAAGGHIDQGFITSYDGNARRGTMLTCPQVFLRAGGSAGGLKALDNPHRRIYQTPYVPSLDLVSQPYAQNVGYSDAACGSSRTKTAGRLIELNPPVNPRTW